MKREGHLIEEIVGIENLYMAYNKAQKGKIAKKDVLEYGKCLERNILKLQRQILSGNIETGRYKFFTIYDPQSMQTQKNLGKV